MTEDEGVAGGKHAIHAYVPTDVHGSFEAYRRQAGLTSGSALLTLLVLREIRLGRLATTCVQMTPRIPKDAKISAYIDAEKADAFRALNAKLGRSTSDCAADLIIRELEERWLDAALNLDTAGVAP